MNDATRKQLANVEEYSVAVPSLKLVELDLVFSRPGPQLTGPQIASEIISEYIGQKPSEHFATLHLNARNEITHYRLVSVGTLVASLVHPREVYQPALLTNSASIVCGHNHPSGDVRPSQEDQAIFERLRLSGEILGIPILDFLIVSPRRNYYSFSERGQCGKSPGST